MVQWPFPWYMAESLEVLRRQLNALAPGRSTASDGGIGDAAHAARVSDHNPNSYRRRDGARQVCARDFTHDPGDLDCQWLADQLVASGDSRIKYVIWNGRIWTPGVGWKPYTGDNPHTKHLHLSVKAGVSGDDGDVWRLTASPSSRTRQLLNGDTQMKLPAEMNSRSEVIALPPDADVKLIFAAKTVIFGGHIYCWSAVPNKGTGGDPVQWRTEVKEGEVISIPRGTTKAEITYSCASEVDLYVQAIA